MKAPLQKFENDENVNTNGANTKEIKAFQKVLADAKTEISKKTQDIARVTEERNWLKDRNATILN